MISNHHAHERQDESSTDGLAIGLHNTRDKQRECAYSHVSHAMFVHPSQADEPSIFLHYRHGRDVFATVVAEKKGVANHEPPTSPFVVFVIVQPPS